MNKEITLIPELRFPEFIDDGDWEKLVVSQVASYENGKAHEQNIVEEGAYIVVNSKFISSDGKVRKYTDNANCLANKDDVLMVLSDVPNGKAIAKCFYVEENNKFTVNQRICKITATDVNSKILYYVLNRNSHLLSFDDGVKQTNLRNEDVLNCPVILPKNPKEQAKISEFVSSLDEVIERHTEKLDLLNDHKRGLMQNLFPQKGEKKPKHRFPEFTDHGEWTTKTLDKIAEFSKGKGISKADITENGVLPCIRYGELYTHYKETIYEVISYTDVPQDELILSQANDVIIPSSGETHEDIATSSCVMLDGIALGGDLNIIRSKINGVFLSYYLNNVKKREIAQMAQGISVVHLYSNQLRNLEITFPSIDEQEKIAALFSGLDEVINEQNKKIDQLRLHKKGLMQSLFPKMND